jgi:hypothetical protein
MEAQAQEQQQRAQWSEHCPLRESIRESIRWSWNSISFCVGKSLWKDCQLEGLWKNFNSTNWFIAASWIIHKDDYKEEMEGFLLKYGSSSTFFPCLLKRLWIEIIWRFFLQAVSLRYWCKQIWSIIITFLWWQSPSTRSRLVGSVTMHSIHLRTLDLHSFWRCIQPNCMVPFEHHKFATIKQHYKWKICCKN